MNERIRELMEEAGIYDFVVESMGIDKEMEKFAELIVRDCLKVINQSNGVGDDDVIRISRDVKQHFGVK